MPANKQQAVQVMAVIYLIGYRILLTYKALVSHAGLVNSEVQWGTSDAIYHREIMADGPPWEQGKTWTEQNPIRLAANFKTP